MASLANLDVLTVLHRAIDELSSLSTNEDIFDFTLRWLKENTEAMLVGLAQCDTDKVMGQIIGVNGDRHLLKVAEQLLGRPLAGSPIMVPLLLQEKAELNHASWREHINPIKQPFNLGVIFSIDSVYGYPIPFQKSTLVAGLVMRRGKTISPHEKLLIELVIKQVSLALNRISTVPSLVTGISAQEKENTAVFYIENGTVIHCTGGVKAVFGLECHQVLNRKVHTWLPKEQADYLRQSTANMLHAVSHGSKDSTTDITFEIGPSLRNVELHMTPVTLPAGKTVVQVTAVDVTEKRQLGKALLESETRYRELFETSTEGITVTDQNGYYLDCNPALLQMLGYDSVDEIRGMNYLDLTPQECHALDLRQKSLLNNEPYVEYEKEYLHHDPLFNSFISDRMNHTLNMKKSIYTRRIQEY